MKYENTSHNYVIKLRAVLLLLAVSSCSGGEGFESLEEKQALLDTAKPLLTKVEDNISSTTEDTIKLNFNNEKIGNDVGMNYQCFFDTVIDKKKGQAKSCNELPDGPEVKFDEQSGDLNWGPLSTIGEYELIITGTNNIGSDTTFVGVIVGENLRPKLKKLLDRSVAAAHSITFKAENIRDENDKNTQYSCQFDKEIDNEVSAGQNCQLLEGEPAIKFDVTSGIFTWNPSETAQGSYEVKVSAVNEHGEDSQVFVISVGESGEKKVNLTFIRDQYIFSGETLTLDVSNQLTGNDEGVSYDCYYDAVIDGVVGTSQSCDQLPGNPTQKFNPITGELSWIPSLSQQTEVEVRIVGTKSGDVDDQIFLVSFSVQKFGEVGNSAITFDPTSYDFGSIALGSASAGKNVTLTNSSSAKIYIGSITLSNAEFIVNWTSCPDGIHKLESQSTCIVNISYQPVTAAQLGAFLNVKFGKTPATNTEFSSVLGLSGRGVGTLNFDGLQTITNVTHNSLTLNWNEATQAASFLIFRVVEVDSVPTLVYLETILNTDGTVVSKNIANLTPSTSYTYRVRATDYVGVVDNNTSDVTVSTLTNKSPSVSPGPDPWNVYSGRIIDNVDFNDNYTGNDLDRDGDTLEYTCRFDNTIDNAVSDGASLCSTIINIDASNPSFNQFTGVLTGWKPAKSDGDSNRQYEIKITAEDDYGAKSSTIFSTTVQIGQPTITAAADQIFPSNYLLTNDTISLDFDNVRFSPYSDIDMTYSCVFERLTPDPPASQDCSNLPGGIAFSTVTGEFEWEPSSASAGSFRFTVTGTNLVASDSEAFTLNLMSPLSFSNRIHHLDARFATLSRSGQNDPSYTATLKDLLAVEADATLYNFDQATAWDGVGTPADPVALVFDGVDDFAQVSSSVNNEGYVRFETWVFPGSNDREKVIFSYGNATENGIILTSKRLWLGKGNGFYSSAVLADTPYVYYRMNNLSNGTATDYSGNNRDGIVATPTGVSDNVDDANFDLESSGALFQGSYIDPNITSGGATNKSLDLSGDWTVETWFYYPFPTGCTSGCYLSRSNTRDDLNQYQDDRVLNVLSNQRLRVYLRNKGGWQYPTPTDASQTYYEFTTLEEGWHHLTIVGTGTGASEQMDYYVDAAKVASLNKRSTMSLKYIGNLNGSSRYTFGYLDEFAFYDKALNATQINNHYEAGQKGSCDYLLKEGYWYHIAGHIDDTSETLNLYLNGQLHCTVSFSGMTKLLGSTEDLTIGRSAIGAASSWNGKIQSLNFYSTGGAAEILTNYNASKDNFASQFQLPPSGLRLWLRSDQGVYQDAEKTTVAANDEDPAVVWEDYSGNGGDLIADDDANDDDTLDTERLPVLRTNVLNGHPVMEFDGIDDYMRNFTAYNEPNTVFLVARYSTKNANSSRGRVLAGANDNWFLGFYNDRIDQFYANGWVHNVAVASNENWHIYAADHSSGDVQRLFKNNVALQSSSGGTAGPRGLGIGGYRYNSQLATCQVAEVIVFDRVLTDSERQEIFNYLNSRYSIY